LKIENLIGASQEIGTGPPGSFNIRDLVTVHGSMMTTVNRAVK
jgi:hypothetical protein